MDETRDKDDARSKVRSIVDDAVREVVPQVLSFSPVEPRYRGASERLPKLQGEQLVSLLGFTGKGFGRCMTLVTEPDTATELRRPLVRNLPSPPDICDWVGELVNQLLGRVQNRVLRDGLEIHMATPSTIRGEALTVVPEDGKSRWHGFNFDRRDVQVRVTIEFEAGFEWEPTPSSDEDPVGEGQAVIF